MGQGVKVSGSYRHGWEPRGAIHFLDGVVDQQVLERSLIAFHADPRYDNIRFLIVDCLNCPRITITSDKIEELAARSAAAARRKFLYRVAVVTTSLEIAALIDFVDQLQFGNQEFQCFATMKAARDWVNSCLE